MKFAVMIKMEMSGLSIQRKKRMLVILSVFTSIQRTSMLCVMDETEEEFDKRLEAYDEVHHE